MGRWVLIIISGLCTFVSFSMAFLALQVGDGGAFLFAGFGVLFGIPFGISLNRVFRKKSAVPGGLDVETAEAPKPVTFVPHRFMLAAVSIGACLLAALLFAILFR